MRTFLQHLWDLATCHKSKIEDPLPPPPPVIVDVPDHVKELTKNNTRAAQGLARTIEDALEAMQKVYRK